MSGPTAGPPNADPEAANLLDVEVVYAQPDRQWRIPLRMPPGATVADAIERSQIARHVPTIVISDRLVGIFYRPCDLSTELEQGDRVEIYRPLLADPKEGRRRRAAGGRL